MGTKTRERTELAFSCTTTACADGLHYFGGKRKEGDKAPGTCHDCGADLINFPRTQRRDLADIEYTVSSLKKEWIRHKYWFHESINIRAINRARRKGLTGTEEAALRIVQRSVGPAVPYRDGYQTPYDSSDIVHYAQHATASCCRKCIEYWHGIPAGRELTGEECNYLVRLVMNYVHHRLPKLTAEGEHVPAIRHQGRAHK